MTSAEVSHTMTATPMPPSTIIVAAVTAMPYTSATAAKPIRPIGKCAPPEPVIPSANAINRKPGAASLRRRVADAFHGSISQRPSSAAMFNPNSHAWVARLLGTLGTCFADPGLGWDCRGGDQPSPRHFSERSSPRPL
jgi:hypothetical protein